MPTPLQWTDVTLRRFWDREALHPENYFTNHSGHRIAARSRQWLHGHKRVLDFGCGLGFFVPHLAALGLEVTATDFTQSAIDATNERNRSIRGFAGAFTLSDLLDRREKFGAIVSVEVVEHLTDDRLAEYLEAMRQMLEPGGTAVVTTPNGENLSALELYCPSCDCTFHRWQHVRSWTRHTLGEALFRAGFYPFTSIETDFSRPWWRRRGRKPHLAMFATLRHHG